MNIKEIDKAINMIDRMKRLRFNLSVYLLDNLDDEHTYILRNLSIIELCIKYLEYDLDKLKTGEKNEK